MRIQIIRTSYFLWLVIPAVLYPAYVVFGLPHVLVYWTERIPRSLSSCSYLGPTGVFEAYTNVDGGCQTIRFRKSAEVAQ